MGNSVVVSKTITVSPILKWHLPSNHEGFPRWYFCCFVLQAPDLNWPIFFLRYCARIRWVFLYDDVDGVDLAIYLDHRFFSSLVLRSALFSLSVSFLSTSPGRPGSRSSCIKNLSEFVLLNWSVLAGQSLQIQYKFTSFFTQLGKFFVSIGSFSLYIMHSRILTFTVIKLVY